MITQIKQNEIRTTCATLTINKDGIILMLNPRNFETVFRLDETRSINAIQGYDVRKYNNIKVVSSDILLNILNNEFDDIKLNLTDDQIIIIRNEIKQNYRHNLLLDIALKMFQFDEVNKLEQEIKDSISIDEMRARILKYDLEQSLKNKIEAPRKTIKI